VVPPLPVVPAAPAGELPPVPVGSVESSGAQPRSKVRASAALVRSNAIFITWSSVNQSCARGREITSCNGRDGRNTSVARAAVGVAAGERQETTSRELDLIGL